MALPDFSKHVQKYKAHIDNVINTLGKNVQLIFESQVSSVGPTFNDPVRNRSTRKPSFKTTNSNPAPSVTTSTLTIKGLVQWNPKDFENFGIKIEQGSNIIRVKTFLRHTPDLMRCKYLIPNLDTESIHQAKFRLFRSPIPRGLGNDEYSITYWIESDGD